MDYKIWIVLLGIVLLILYLIKEMYFIKFDLINYINTLKNNNEENNLIIRKNFQNDLNVFANKIKLLNDENLQQFRKITLLNNQPILKNNNYFREMEYTDSDIENKDLRYLSDSKLMSKKEKESSNKFSETSELTSTETSEENVVANKKEQKEQPSLPISNELIKNVLNNVINKALNNQELSTEKINTDDLTLNKKSESTNDINEKVSEKENDNILETKNIVSNSLQENKNNEDNIIEDNNISESNIKSISSIENNNRENTKLDYILETDSETETELEEDNDEESESDEITFDKDELELKENNFSNKINNKDLVENAENIKFDTITLGTKKSKNKKENKNEKNDLNEIKMPDEIARNVNKENLKSIDDYTLETLKNLAKKFNIPLSIKSSGKWKSLNKTEIYSEISKFLNKKNLN
jgi:hypothetical protein